MSETWRHDRIRVNGVGLHYVTQGEGPLMLMLHGFPEFWYSWRKQIPAFAKTHRVVALDMRGYNESDKPNGRSAYAIERLVADAAAVIRKLGEGVPAILVGHDWGGMVAWASAYRHPDLLRALIVLNIPHPARFAAGVLRPRQLLRSWYIGAFQVPWLPESVLTAGGGRLLKSMLRASSAGKAAFTEADLEAYAEAATRHGAMTAMINYYRAAYSLAGRRWGVLQLPTLMIWGERDVALGKELTYGTDRYVADLTVRYIPDAGHWVQQERPREVNRYMAEFLRRVGA